MTRVTHRVPPIRRTTIPTRAGPDERIGVRARTNARTGTEAGAGNFRRRHLRIGKDLPTGTYRSSEKTDACYWATLTGFSGELDDIIKNGNSSPAIVTVDKSVTGFETQGCGDWIDVAETFPSRPATKFGDGMFVVGKHIKPGQYRADGGGDLCYWARLKSFKGDGLSAIIANGNAATIVQIDPSDGGFEARGCGEWSR